MQVTVQLSQLIQVQLAAPVRLSCPWPVKGSLIKSIVRRQSNRLPPSDAAHLNDSTSYFTLYLNNE
jgi:hypothetical protein